MTKTFHMRPVKFVEGTAGSMVVALDVTEEDTLDKVIKQNFHFLISDCLAESFSNVGCPIDR